jgi:hypothetical protein
MKEVTKVEFVGPRPIVTASGITFYEAKKDKFIYILPALYILQLLEGEKLDIEKLEPEVIFDILAKNHKDFEDIVRYNFRKYQQKLENELYSLQDEIDSCPKECRNKEALLKNLKDILDYRLQRGFNKIVYKELIELIAKKIYRENIPEIDMRLSAEFIHIIVSINSVLAREYGVTYNRELNVDEESGKAVLRLYLPF